jgi:hypothetical protein
MIMARPWVRQWCGTWAMSPSKKRAFVGPGLLGESLDAGARRKGRTRLVEAHVSVGADTQELQIDPACLGDRGFVRRARRRDVLGETVRPVESTGDEVHPPGHLVLDHVPIALGVLLRKAHVLVERERPGPREGESVLDWSRTSSS